MVGWSAIVEDGWFALSKMTLGCPVPLAGAEGKVEREVVGVRERERLRR